MITHSDCKYYTGLKPCGKYEQCALCPHYAPWGKQILIIKLAAIGDVVRTTTILPGLKKHEVDCCITWLTDPASIPMLATNPLIDRLYPFTAPGLSAIQACDYDLVLNFEKEARALGVVRTVNAIRRKGFVPGRGGKPIAADSDSEYALQLGLSDKLKFHDNKLTYPQIIYEMVGLPYDREEYILELSDMASAFAREFAGRNGLRGDLRAVGLNTGCGEVFATKRWTVDGFVELIDEIAPLPNVRVLLLGGPLEVDFNRAIIARAGQKVLDTGCDNSLEQFLGIIECCGVVVSADTLAMHLAIGRKKQVVALLGATSHTEIDLYGRGEKIVTDFPCAPCYLSICDKSPTCMQALRGSTAAAAVGRCLEKRNAER